MKRKVLVLFACIFMLALIGCNKDIQENDKAEIKMEYGVDLTHDGNQESVVLKMKPAKDGQVEGTLTVYDFSDILYERELYPHATLWESFYLVNYNDKDYLMIYKNACDHEEISCYYEIFSLSDTGEIITFDADEVQQSLLNVDSLDKNRWLKFAEKENQYFADAFLIVNTDINNFIFSESDDKITYTETFAWLPVKESGKTIEENLERFISETKKVYTEGLFIDVGIPDDELSLMQKVLFNKEEYNDGEKIADVEGVYKDEFERAVKFCVVDLDHDGENEICLSYASGSVLIFHEIDGHIYGYDYVWRGFNPVYNDGTFCGSGGASYSEFYGKVSFTKDEFQKEVITAVEYFNDEGTIVYYKNGGRDTGVVISKEEYDQIMSKYEMIIVEEYDFTIENVLKYVK